MTEFDDIRPYNKNEIPGAISELVSDPMFVSIVDRLYNQPGEKEGLLKLLSTIDNVDDFQEKIICPLLLYIEKISTNGITFSEVEQFHQEEKYLFISNHRDIILDSALLNLIAQKGNPENRNCHWRQFAHLRLD